MTQMRMAVFFINSPHQSTQFPTNIPRSAKGLAQQQGLEPAVEVLHRAIALGHARGDEDRLYSQSQAQADDPAEIASGIAEATELAAVVKLDLFRQAQVLPGVHQELQDHVHLAAADELYVDGLVEDVLADQEVVASRSPFQVAGSDDIDLVHLVGVLSVRHGILAPSQPGRQPQQKAGQPSAGNNAFDGAQTGQRRVTQGLQFSSNLGRPYQTVAGLGCRSCCQPAAAGSPGSGCTAPPVPAPGSASTTYGTRVWNVLRCSRCSRCSPLPDATGWLPGDQTVHCP